MRRLVTLIAVVGVFILALRVTTLESLVNDLQEELKTNNFEVNHRMQDYEHYIEFLKREYEPYIQEEKMKELNERL